jgi:hypothetical protein
MKKLISIGLIATALFAVAAGAAPKIEFGQSGVRALGFKPGTRVAWMALVRKNHEYHKENIVVRGLEVATGNGSVDLDRDSQAWTPGTHAIWTVADVDGATGSRATSPTFRHSQRPIVIRHTETTIEIEAPVVELMYVRGRSGVWSLGAGDGSLLDEDRQRNGIIVISLATLQPYKGNPHPPERVAPGDLVLVIDPYEVRAGQYEVPR